MDLVDILRVVRRRWLVAAAVLVVTAALAVLTAGQIPPSYTMEGTYLLVGQDEGASGAADAAARDEVVNNEVVAAVLRAEAVDAAGDDELTIAVDSLAGSTVLSLRVSGPTLERAQAGLDALLDRLPTILRDLSERAGMPADAVTFDVLSRGVTSVVTQSDLEALDTGLIPSSALPPLGTTVGAATSIETVDRTAFGPDSYTATVLQASLTAPQVVDELTAGDGTDEFRLEHDSRMPAPLVRMAVVGTDEAAVVKSFDAAEEVMMTTLATLQQDAQTARLEPLGRPDGPTDVERNARRIVAVVALLGLALAVAAAVAFDAIAARRAARKRPEALGTEPPSEVPSGPPVPTAVSAPSGDPSRNPGDGRQPHGD